MSDNSVFNLVKIILIYIFWQQVSWQLFSKTFRWRNHTFCNLNKYHRSYSLYMCSSPCVFGKGVDQWGFHILQPQASQGKSVEGRLRTDLRLCLIRKLLVISSTFSSSQGQEEWCGDNLLMFGSTEYLSSQPKLRLHNLTSVTNHSTNTRQRPT